jgi:restriction system protein
MDQLPTFDQLINPLLKALHDLGGSGTIEEIYEKVTEGINLSEAVLSIPHNPERSDRSEVDYRLGWARTYLKKYGLLQNSSRGVWSIATDKRHVVQVDPREVVRTVRDLDRKEKNQRDNGLVAKSTDEELIEEDVSWKAKLHRVLTTDLDPGAFERLIMRLLRESGFVQVEVTGRTGDGGIDGKGIARIHGFLSFHVVFQAKRYQGSVSAGQVRDFRGAMVGRADKGLFVTTGTFTRDAIKEATRDGAPPIDLVDGDQLADKLKELSLGIKTEQVEVVTIDSDWYQAI